MKKVSIKGPIKLVSTNRSIFFTFLFYAIIFKAVLPLSCPRVNCRRGRLTAFTSMDSKVKIAFSQQELARIYDSSFLLSRNLIMEKMYALFYHFSQTITASPAHQSYRFPEATNILSPKISRGENYNGLPYIMMDFPALFSKENIFAFRTLFWWSNFFSFTLHLKGTPLAEKLDTIIRNMDLTRDGPIVYYSGADAWNHNLMDKNYLPFSDPAAVRRQATAYGFLKLSRKLELARYAELEQVGLITYELFLTLTR